MKLSTFIRLVKKAYLIRYSAPDNITYICFVMGEVCDNLTAKNPKLKKKYDNLYYTMAAQIDKAIDPQACVEHYLRHILQRKATPEECHNFRLCMLNDMYEAAVLEEQNNK